MATVMALSATSISMSAANCDQNGLSTPPFNMCCASGADMLVPNSKPYSVQVSTEPRPPPISANTITTSGSLEGLP